MNAGLEFEQDVEVEPVRPSAQPPDDVITPLLEPVVDEFAGVFFQSDEVEVGDPGFAHEADQQVADHFRVREQPFIAVVVIGHLSPWAFRRWPYCFSLNPPAVHLNWLGVLEPSGDEIPVADEQGIG